MADYKELLAQAAALAEDNFWDVSVFANVSSLLYESMENVSWAGFYVAESYILRSMYNGGPDRLLLGPFCGKPACIMIPFGKGVCGTSAAKMETVVVKDVECFPGHIACDPDSRSEIVVPLIMDGRCIGVLDIDSNEKGRFGEKDKEGLEAVCRMLEKTISERSLKL